MKKLYWIGMTALFFLVSTYSYSYSGEETCTSYRWYSGCAGNGPADYCQQREKKLHNLSRSSSATNRSCTFDCCSISK